MSGNLSMMMSYACKCDHLQAWASAGTLGFTNSRKKTTHAAEAVAGHMADKVRTAVGRIRVHLES